MLIELGKGKFEAKFNVNCLFNVLRQNGYNKLSDLQTMFNIGDDPKIDDIDNMAHLVYEGIRENCRQNNEDFDVEIEDIRPWMFEDNSRLEQVVNEVMRSMPSQEQDERDAQEGDKKKGTKKSKQ